MVHSRFVFCVCETAFFWSTISWAKEPLETVAGKKN